MLAFLVVHSGQMELTVLEANNAAQSIAALRQFRQRHRHLHGVFLIHDSGPSHTAQATSDYLAQDTWWRPRLTPTHASWLNQAELLVNTFKAHYVRRGSWASREQFLKHIQAACPEYNQRYAHPFEWTWTNQKMRNWYAKHTS